MGGRIRHLEGHRRAARRDGSSCQRRDRAQSDIAGIIDRQGQTGQVRRPDIGDGIGQRILSCDRLIAQCIRHTISKRPTLRRADSNIRRTAGARAGDRKVERVLIRIITRDRNIKAERAIIGRGVLNLEGYRRTTWRNGSP